MSSPVRVAYIVRSWPRLSQTFVLNEILALERIGVAISVFSMTRSDEAVQQPQVAEVVAPVQYLDGGVRDRLAAHRRVAGDAPLRYLATLLFALRSRHLFGGYTNSGAMEAFRHAVQVADGLRANGRRGNAVSHIHAHFAHDPALIGLLAHRLTGLPFSFTAHARDLYQIPPMALAGRAREATAVVTCCRANQDYITSVLGDIDVPVHLIYHGVDLRRFRPERSRDGRSPPLIVSVGRLVEKKGFDDLLGACAVLASEGHKFRCDIYGDGPRRQELESVRDRLGLRDIVHFAGPRTQAELIPIYHEADVFALTPRVTSDGDRDGVPNVLVEAMACARPVVSTPVGGIPEVVSHGDNGLLAGANDQAAIAGCLGLLLDDAERRRRLGQAAAQSVARFDSQQAARRLAALFGAEMAEP